MAVDYYSFDYDGCVGVPGLTDIVAQNPLLVAWLNDRKIANTQRKAFIGSNRQSTRDDARNEDHNRNGSAFIHIPKLCQAMKIEFIKFLASDAYNGKRDGTTFEEALNIINKVEIPAIPYGWLHDPSKITLLYLQMQKAAALEAPQQVEFFFFDDKEDILEGLHKFFDANKSLIPANLTLNLVKYAYSGDNIHTLDNFKTPIKGEGAINYACAETLRQCADQIIANTKEIDDFKGNRVKKSEDLRQVKYNLGELIDFSKPMPVAPRKVINKDFNVQTVLVEEHTKAITQQQENIATIDAYIEKVTEQNFTTEQNNFLIAAKIQELGLSNVPKYKALQRSSPFFDQVHAMIQDPTTDNGKRAMFNKEFKILTNTAMVRFIDAADSIIKKDGKAKLVDVHSGYITLSEIVNISDQQKFAVGYVQNCNEAFSTIQKYELAQKVAQSGQAFISELSALPAGSLTQAKLNLPALNKSLPLIADFLELTKEIIALYSTSSYAGSMKSMLEKIQDFFDSSVTRYKTDKANEIPYSASTYVIEQDAAKLAADIALTGYTSAKITHFATNVSIAEKKIRDFCIKHKLIAPTDVPVPAM